jgi:asparagine synthase (glutamine-hydrolysing)
MRASIELREPFLDHRLVELALRQPADRKIRDGVHKWLLRGVARQLVPADVRLAPKRPVQTPQREWLAGPLRDWTEAALAGVLARRGGSWLMPDEVWRAWREYVSGANDNSYFLWQWISLGLALEKESAIAHV